MVSGIPMCTCSFLELLSQETVCLFDCSATASGPCLCSLRRRGKDLFGPRTDFRQIFLGLVSTLMST